MAIENASSRVAVRTMFNNFTKRGSARTSYLRTTPTIDVSGKQEGLVRYGTGFVDYFGPISAEFPINTRLISGVALKKSTDYIIRMQMAAEVSLLGTSELPSPLLTVSARLYKRPISSLYMPIHAKERTIKRIAFHVPFGTRRTVSRHLETMKPERVFAMLASRNAKFLEMVKRFNSLVDRA